MTEPVALVDTADLLARADWVCTSTPPGSWRQPEELLSSTGEWWPAEVPGTAAGALRSAGVADALRRDYDAEDWWFTTRVSTRQGSFDLVVGGLATLADLWVDGEHVLHSENMFRRSLCRLQLESGVHEIAIRCAALGPELLVRRPRPRWKSAAVRHQGLRWIRTSLLGRVLNSRIPAPVGPWRPVSLRPADSPLPRQVELRARPHDDGGGTVEVRFRLPAELVDRIDGIRNGGQSGACLSAGGARLGMQLGAVKAETTLMLEIDGDGLLAQGRLQLRHVERWWPHTHGPQPLYRVFAVIGDQPMDLGRVGFRTVEVDQRDGAFTLVVNNQPIFARGACWLPPDPLRPCSDDRDLRWTLDLLRRANANMVRVPGTSVYEDQRFFEVCDELGILVWHDCMFAFMDPPQDASFNDDVEHELRDAFADMAGHPCVAVICGSQEVEEIAAMNGLEPDRRRVDLMEKRIPRVLEQLLPDVVYLSSNPTGGELPFQADVGVSQYFGVGGYMRPIEDARRANVRFAAECLAFSTPPERPTVARHFGGAAASHSGTWKDAVHRDPGGSWDMEDISDSYLEMVFGVDARRLRYEDPERALDLTRATIAEVMTQVLSEWRRSGSPCAGALILSLRDQLPGGGWGIVDADGFPKAPWYALQRALAPVAVLVTDEGLNGLNCHLVNDAPGSFEGYLSIEIFARGRLAVERGRRPVEVPGRSGLTVNAESLLSGFRDLTYAYRFGPPAHDVVAVSLLDALGEVRSEAVFLPHGQARPREESIGLTAEVAVDDRGLPVVSVASEQFGQWVVIEVPGFVAEDSWFHLAPGRSHSTVLAPCGPGMPAPDGWVRGRVRALNSHAETTVSFEMPSGGLAGVTSEKSGTA